MAFSRCREPYVGDFTPSPSTASESLPSIGSSTPRSLDGDLPSLPFITPLSTLSARFESLDMNRTIERFLAFRRPDAYAPVHLCAHAHHAEHRHRHAHEHPSDDFHHSAEFATHRHHKHGHLTSLTQIPRISLDRLHQFHQRHSCPPELRTANAATHYTNYTCSTNYASHTSPQAAKDQRPQRNPPPPPARIRKVAVKTSMAYQIKAAEKCRGAAKMLSKTVSSSTRIGMVAPPVSDLASDPPLTTHGPTVTPAALQKPRAKRLPPKNIDALANLFTKCVRHYTDFVPGPKVYFTTDELKFVYREVLDQHSPPDDDRWLKFARKYITEEGRELYQCLLLKEGAKEDCACRYGQTKQAVKRHINDVHFNTRSWKCPFDGCDKAFKQRCTLKIHICVRHTGETPYLCQYCSYRFSDPAQRSKHYKSNHPDREHPKRIKQAHDLPMNEADVYGCFFCPERCVDSMSRALHCKECHPDKFIPNVIRGRQCVPAPVVHEEEDEVCDHEDGCDCDFD